MKTLKARRDRLCFCKACLVVDELHTLESRARAEEERLQRLRPDGLTAHETQRMRALNRVRDVLLAASLEELQRCEGRPRS